MDKKLWLSIIAAMIGASLLVAAGYRCSGEESGLETKHATKGGTSSSSSRPTSTTPTRRSTTCRPAGR